MTAGRSQKVLEFIPRLFCVISYSNFLKLKESASATNRDTLYTHIEKQVLIDISSKPLILYHLIICFSIHKHYIYNFLFILGDDIMHKELKTAACYIRVSTDKQEELSPASQLKEIKKWAKDNGYILTDNYIFMENEGISGRKAEKRLEFQRMIATAKVKPKPFDAIIVWKFSRFARNQEESTFYKGLLRKKLGIDVISISEPVLEGMFGRLIEMIIEWFDEYYSVNLSGEVMRGMTEKARRGGYQSDTAYGYRMNKDTGIPEIIPEEAEIVRTIFDMCCDMSNSYYDICLRLNSMGAKTKRGNPWELRSVKYVLSNPFYTGKVRWNRQHHESHTIKDKSEWIIADGKHEPIISQEKWDMAQDIMSKRALRAKPKMRPMSTKHWLSGLIKCDACGSSLFLGATGKNGMKSLQCGNYQKGKCSISHSITEDKITVGLIAALSEILKSSEPIKYTRIESKSAEVDYLFYENALAKIEQKEKRIKQAYRDGIDTIEEYKENKAIINAEREKLENQYASLTLKKNTSNASGVITDLIDYSKEIQNVIDIIQSEAENTVKGEAIRSIIDYAVYKKAENRLEVHLIKYT